MTVNIGGTRQARVSITAPHRSGSTRGRFSGRGSNDWLLIKKRDEHATAEPPSGASVLSGLTIDELAARAPRHRAVVEALSGLPKKPITELQPMLCQTADAAFSGKDWIFELKYDGFRMLARGGAGTAALRYRSGQDVTDRFPELTSAIRARRALRSTGKSSRPRISTQRMAGACGGHSFARMDPITSSAKSRAS